MINDVMLIGRAGKTPELYTTQSGKKVTKFTVATWENYKDESQESGWRTETEWHNVVVWGVSAESIAKNVKKGMLVYVKGKIQTRSYQDKDGATKYITEIIGYARALESQRTEQAQAPAARQTAPKTNDKSDPANIVDDILQEGDLPF